MAAITSPVFIPEIPSGEASVRADCGSPGRPNNLVLQPAEQDHQGNPERRRHVGRPAVVPDEHGSAGQERFHLAEGRTTNYAVPAEGSQIVAGTPDENRFQISIPLQILGYRQKPFRPPGLVSGCRRRVNDRVGTRRRARFGVQARAWDLCDRHAQVKHGGGEVFGGMHGPIYCQYLLGAGDFHGVNGGAQMVREAGPVSGERSHE